MKKWPAALKHKIEDNFFDIVPAFGLGIAIVAWGNSAFEAEVKKHRD